MTATLPVAAAGVQGPYMNWRSPLHWTAVVTRVEPDHLLLRDYGDGALLPGCPLLHGQEPAQAALGALRGAGSEQLVLLPALIDRRQQTRRQVLVHTFITEPVARCVAERFEPTDGRSTPLIVPRLRAFEMLPPRACLRTQFALATREFKDTAIVEWKACSQPVDPLGVPVGWSPARMDDPGVSTPRGPEYSRP